MDRKGQIKVCLVNRFYPPDKSVTAESASDLARHLIDKGLDVHIVCSKAKYDGGGASGETIGKIHYIKSVPDGKNKITRLFSSLLESRRLILKAVQLKPDIVIVMTTPPLLNFFACRKLKKKGIPWIYWSLDLFPEAFLANRLVSKNNIIYRYVKRQCYSYNPTMLIALGEKQADYLNNCFGRELPSVIIPCGVFINNKKEEDKNSELPGWKSNTDLIYFGYVGNLGEAHSAVFLEKLIENLDAERHRLVMVVYGSKSERLKTFVQNHKDLVILKEFLPREELAFVDVHLTSLKPEWLHVSVPSKLVSAVHLGGSFLFYGPENGDSWHYLKDSGWIINPEQDLEFQVRAFLEQITIEKVKEKKRAAAAFSPIMEQHIFNAYEKLSAFLCNKTD